jgi:hypothetical protein
MAELDDDKLELLERRLAERVTERVRPALFRLYATAGLAVIGVLGFVSWDLVSEIRQDIGDKISKDIEDKRNEIFELVTETRVVAKRANDVILRVEKQLQDFEPRAESLDETVEKVDSLNVRSQDFLAIYEQELKPVVATVASLSEQLKVLAEQVKDLNQISPAAMESTAPEPEKTPRQRSDAIENVISQALEASRNIVEARGRNTVFFQYTGGLRQQAEELAAALRSLGYNVPGVDREAVAAGKHEVRYFHEDDRTAAEDLARDTTDALRREGYGEATASDVVAQSFVAYGGKKPRTGVLELWLELPQQVAWADTSPGEGFCYQEDRLEDGAERYSVHCHATPENCEKARGPNPRYQQSDCLLVSLRDADWTPAKGYMGSLYAFRSEPFGAPFPLAP